LSLLASRSSSYIHEFILVSVSIGFGIILGAIIFKAIWDCIMKYQVGFNYCNLTPHTQERYDTFIKTGFLIILFTLVLMFILLFSYLRLNDKYRKILIAEFLLSLIISMIGLPTFFGGIGCVAV